MMYKELSPSGKIKKAVFINDATHEQIDLTDLFINLQKLEYQQRKVNKLLAKEAK